MIDVNEGSLLTASILVPVNNRTTRPPASTTPRPRYNASCDFDVDKELCGWKSDTVDVWNVIHERDIDINYGPASDYSSISMLSSLEVDE